MNKVFDGFTPLRARERCVTENLDAVRLDYRKLNEDQIRKKIELMGSHLKIGGNIITE